MQTFFYDFLFFHFKIFDFHKIICTEKLKNEKNKGLSETRLIFFRKQRVKLKGIFILLNIGPIISK